MVVFDDETEQELRAMLARNRHACSKTEEIFEAEADCIYRPPSPVRETTRPDISRDQISCRQSLKRFLKLRERPLQVHGCSRVKGRPASSTDYPPIYEAENEWDDGIATSLTDLSTVEKFHRLSLRLGRFLHQKSAADKHRDNAEFGERDGVVAAAGVCQFRQDGGGGAEGGVRNSAWRGEGQDHAVKYDIGTAGVCR